MGWFSGTKPKVTQMPAWSPEQQNVSGLLSQYLTGQLGQQAQTYPGMAGLTTPTGMERESLGLLEQYMGGTDPIAMQSEELLKKLMAGESGIDPEVMKRYLSTVVYGPAKQRFEEETMPGIAGAYGKGGAYFSTMRGAAETKAGGDFAEQMNRIATEMAYKEQQDRLTKQAQAMQVGLGYTPGKIETGMKYGGLERELQQLPYMDWLSAQQRTQQQQSTIMQQLQQYLSQQPFQNVVTPGQEGVGQSLMKILPYLFL